MNVHVGGDGSAGPEISPRENSRQLEGEIAVLRDELTGLGFSGRAGFAPAAVLREKADEPVHVLVVGAVDDEAAVLAALREAGAD